MRIASLPYEEDKRIRTISAVGSLIAHLVTFILLSLIVVFRPKSPDLIELDWGGSGGGSGENVTFSESASQQSSAASQQSTQSEKMKVDVPTMKSSSTETIPALKKKPLKRASSGSETIASSRRSKHTRAGGGKSIGTGIGNSQGYSIDWGGVGSRRLLSGRVPKYPEGTNKEMAVLLQFSVLPDGSVTNIIPLRKSDELLEREAISALRTWRFDPLPSQFDQKPQVGKITFNFKLE